VKLPLLSILIVLVVVLIILAVIIVFLVIRKKKPIPVLPEEAPAPHEPRDLKEEWHEAAAERQAFFSEFEAKLERIRTRNPLLLSTTDRQDLEAVHTVLSGMKAMGEEWGPREFFYMGLWLSHTAWIVSGKGMFAEAEKFFRQAGEHFQKSIVLNKYDPDAHDGLANALCGLGWALAGLGDLREAKNSFKSAMHACETAMHMRSEFADAWCNMGLAWEGMAKTESSWKVKKSLAKAINHYNVALKLNPAHDLAMEYLARATSTMTTS